jgi:hypothetical protein
MFEDIDKAIVDKLKQREIAASTGAPQSSVVAPFTGVIVSMPGTEKVILRTTEYDFMTCIAAGDAKKQRYCIVRRTQAARYEKEPVDSNGCPVSIVTRLVFDAMVNTVGNATKIIKEKDRQIEMLSTKCEAYKMTLDSLRKNGVID